MAIRSKELEPTRENLVLTLSKDLLDRNKSVWQFARFCDAQDDKCSIALNAKWGSGKTFFVRHVQLLIESFNPVTNAVSEEERKKIRCAFEQFAGKGENAIDFEPAVCVYYDAWENDNDGDPIISLVYEIIKQNAQHDSFKKEVDCIRAAALIADFFTGKNVTDIVDHLQEKDLLAKLKEQREIHDQVVDFLESLLSEQGNRLVVFIDELDRCKPEYAVQLLERIKHYLTNDRITFVFSVNIEELQHTIKSLYGDGFDACRYLDRFFDYRIELPPANMNRYYQELGLDNGSWIYESVCKAVIEYLGLGLREIEKYYRFAKIAAYKPTHQRSGYDFSDEKANQFSLCIIVPIVIGLRMVNTELYDDFITGKNPNPLLDIVGDGDIARGYCSALLNRSESYDADPKAQTTHVSLRDKLVLAYKALFDDSMRGEYDETRVGEYTFSKRTKSLVLRVSSMISEYANYE